MATNTKKIRREVVVDGVRTWITANTEQEYADKLLGFKTNSVKKSGISFRDYADTWFEVFAKPNVAEVTANTYQRQLRVHINPVIGHMDLKTIEPLNIQTVFNQMGDETAQETKNKVKTVLNQIFKMAVEEKIIVRNPMDSVSLKIKGAPSVSTEPYSVFEMRYMAAHLKDLLLSGDRAWLALSISLPLRPEEVLGLKWSDIDEASQTLYVRHTVTHPTRNAPVFKTYTKTEASRRQLAIPQAILKLLPERGKDDDFVIGGSDPISYTRLRAMRTRIAKQICFDGEIVPRRFRTTVATDISAETHDLKLVQKMLGHATPQMTLKHYDKGRSTTADASDAISQCYGLCGTD